MTDKIRRDHPRMRTRRRADRVLHLSKDFVLQEPEVGPRTDINNGFKPIPDDMEMGADGIVRMKPEPVVRTRRKPSGRRPKKRDSE